MLGILDFPSCRDQVPEMVGTLSSCPYWPYRAATTTAYTVAGNSTSYVHDLNMEQIDMFWSAWHCINIAPSTPFFLIWAWCWRPQPQPQAVTTRLRFREPNLTAPEAPELQKARQGECSTVPTLLPPHPCAPSAYLLVRWCEMQGRPWWCAKHCSATAKTTPCSTNPNQTTLPATAKKTNSIPVKISTEPKSL